MDKEDLNLPFKVGRILNIVLVGLVLIALRLWVLAMVQHEERLQESRLPGKRSVILSPHRGTIRDRFNVPLALNQLRYEAAILYSDLKSVPSVVWEADAKGKKVKIFKRKEYIKNLSRLLADELKLDEGRLEDEIHAKASQFFNVPYVIKENLHEEEYARLKMLAKDWPGLFMRRVGSRIYPKGKLAADVIGYLGAIGKEDYEAIIREREELKLLLEGLDLGADLPLPEGYKTLREVKSRLKDLEELAYSAADFVGKTGVEAHFEEELRGFQGKTTFFVDSQGHKIREYPGKRNAVPGKRLLVSLSSELQEYAEKLLALSEETRDTRVKIAGTTQSAKKAPWIKGGAILAIDPHTGETLALASYPRFDPNDFNQKHEDKIHEWLESEASLASIWEGRGPLRRERYDLEKDQFWDEEKHLSWEVYLDLILSSESEIKKKLIDDIKTVFRGVEVLKHPFEADPKLLDLLSIALDERLFSPLLLKEVGKISIADHRAHEQAFSILQKSVEEISRKVFRQQDFQEWRSENEAAFIKEKRAEETLGNRFPRPYLDYLDEEEKLQFRSLWERNKNAFVLALLTGKGEISPYSEALLIWKKEIEQGAHSELSWVKSYHQLKKVLESLSDAARGEYLATLRTYGDLIRPLRYPWKLPKKGSLVLIEKHLARAFAPPYGWGFGRSHAYRQAAIQGSIFKLVTAYTALIQKWKKGENFDLFKMEDRYYKRGSHTYVGYTADKKPIPQLYKGGRIPRSHTSKIGDVDLLGAIELSSNPYFALLASDVIDKPGDLLAAASSFSYGKRTGIDLPYELAGQLPKDLDTNPTGLFAFSIGQHSLTVTPLQTAVMLASLANGGKILKPQVVTLKAGKRKGKFYEEVPLLQTYPYKDALYLSGVDFPLFSLPSENEERLITPCPTEVRETIALPEEIRKLLLEGMHRVVKRQAKSSLFSLSRIYKDYPGLIADFVDMKHRMIGKTSTSEAFERLNLDLPDENSIYSHVWFGGISFNSSVKALRFDKPELIVVVYLRYGGYGNEAAPIAAQIAKKWHEMNRK